MTTLLSIVLIIVTSSADSVRYFDHQQFVDLAVKIFKENPKCTALLHNINLEAANLITAKAKIPLLILSNSSNKYHNVAQQLLSSKQTKCAIILAQDDTLDKKVIEHLLNQSTHRTVYIWQMKQTNIGDFNFASYFIDSIILVKPDLTGGNLLLTNYDERGLIIPANKIIWLKRKAQIVTSNPGFTLSNNLERSSLRGRDVTVSGATTMPFVVVLPNKQYGGFEIDVLKIISEKIGFQYKIRGEKVSPYRDHKTKRWIGSAGSVINGISQFGTTVSVISGSGLACPVHFAQPIGFITFNYLVPKPKPLKPIANFMRPFTLSVWLGFVVLFIMCSVLALQIDHGDKSISPSRIFFDLFGSMWQHNIKSALTSPNSGVYLIIFGFWTIGTFFKGAAYNCNLRAFMIKVDYDQPIETEEDMLSRNVDIYIGKGQGMAEEFQRSSSPTKRALYERMVQRDTLFAMTDGRVTPSEERMIKTGGARFVARIRSTFILDVFEKHFGYQPLRATKFNAIERFGGTVMPLHQPWTDEVDVIVIRLLAAGIVDFLTSRYLPPEKSTSNDNKDVLESYKVDHVLGSLIVLGSGLTLSLFAFCWEVTYHKLLYLKLL